MTNLTTFLVASAAFLAGCLLGHRRARPPFDMRREFEYQRPG